MKFYSFEGLDGCGKSTAMKLVANKLANAGKNVYVTREPGGTTLGEAIRNYLLKDKSVEVGKHAEALLFATSRAQLYDEVINPNKGKNIIILCDRFIDSSVAYQGWASDLGIIGVEEINDFGINGFRPNKVFYIDIPEDVRLARIAGESLDKIESNGDEYFKRVRDGFNKARILYDDKRAYYESYGEDFPSKFVTIDGNRTKEEVAQDIFEKIMSDCLQHY